MLVYIEFFDENAVENICGCLACVPDKVILVGNNEKKLIEHCERYHSFFLDRKNNIDFTPEIIRYIESKKKEIEIDMLSNVADQLSAIVRKYIDKNTCVIDLTGGQDLMLVAAGIVYERFKDQNLQMHRFNLRNNKLYNCDIDKNTISVDTHPKLTANELIRLYGGAIVYESDKHGTTYSWEWSEDFINDVDMMWRVCRKNVRAWNKQISVFVVAEDVNVSPDPLVTTADMTKLETKLNEDGAEYVDYYNIIDKLEKYGLITFDSNEESISVTYKNEQVKRCLTKAGQALETRITLSAMRARDKYGNPVYHNVVNGAYIDWDNKLDEKDNDTHNEIDVLLMHGTVPVFVSCKNGWVDMDELYKLDTVAERFGGRYAKKVLVATALDKDGSFAKQFKQRADDMDITIVDDILDTTDKALERAVGKFWSGGGNSKKAVNASKITTGFYRHK